MANDPDQIRCDIEATRRELGADVEALRAKVDPSEAVHRRARRVRVAAAGVRDRLMGTAADAAESVESRARSAASEVAGSVEDAASSTGELASSAAEAVRSAPRQVQRRTQGTPLAAGVVAFGLGWVVSALLPPSHREQELARRATDVARDHAPTVTDGLAQAGHQLEEDLRGPVQHAAASVRTTATEAASTVADEGRRAAGAVADRTDEARDRVQDYVTDPGPASQPSR